MRLTGLGVSPGIAIGRALVLKQSAREIRFRIPEGTVSRELERLERACGRSRRQLQEIRAHVARVVGAEHAYLFDAQLLMLDDPMLVERARALVRDERLNAEWALGRAGQELSTLFDAAEDPYLRERQGDVTDVVGRLRLNLRAGEAAAADPRELLDRIAGPVVLVADTLPPSLAAQIDWSRVVGFVTDAGSWTYHTAILARSLRVPAVVGLHDASAQVLAGTTVALDGTTGEVLIDPEPAVVRQIQARGERRTAYERSLEEFRRHPAVTRDGLRIRLDANIELLEDLDKAREYGADGIGLYRSEFLLRSGPLETLTEERQIEVYRTMLARLAPHPVTIRTFDIASDELEARSATRDPERSRLGLRGVRLALARRDLLRTQCRALLRAACAGRLRIMFPFVSGVEELRAARAIVDEVRTELQPGAPAEVPIGIMIEVPSAAWTADLLAEEADFFSIGTNDLIQYCLAVDRTDDRVSHLYQPLHPAILRAIRQIRRGARRRRIPVAVCGEMAADPALLALLIGLGVTEFSMTPAVIPIAKQVISDLRAAEARQIAARVLRCRTAGEIERELSEQLASARADGDASAVNE